MKLIVAVDKKWGIGKNNDLLFSIPEDMKFFKQKTEGKTVVMGQKTLLSLPRSQPLKNRTNIVLCADKDFVTEGAIFVSDLDMLFEELEKYNTDEVFVVGGATVYKLLLDYCDSAFITKVNADGGAELFFPNLDNAQNWECVSTSQKIVSNDLEIQFCEYKNSQPKSTADTKKRIG